MKNLGIGVQYFGDFKTDNLIYVDKTESLYEMMGLPKHNFIVRPRRFGKSLLLSTIDCIYQGRKDLFEGTWIYDKIDWEKEKRPTLRLDFTLIEYNACSLEKGIQDYLQPIAEHLALALEDTSARNMFKRIIEKMAETTQIVILIDEYEMAVTDFVGTNDPRLDENITTLKKLYGVLKGASQFIHRSFITGVSKIGKISILSDLNMLNDLTLHERFTTLLGYTEKELRFYFADYIKEAARREEMSEEEILAEIKFYYNGYSWDGIVANKVYNPFSIVNYFQNFAFRNYWFDTGTPTVLIRGARLHQLTLNDLDKLEVTGELLGNADLKNFYSISLLFQAGYLSIKEARKAKGGANYRLGFPNEEVKKSFASHLLTEYVGKDWGYVDTTISHKLKLCIENEDWENMFRIFPPVIESTSYNVNKFVEGYFHTIMHVLVYSTGLVTFSELESQQGRLDMVTATYTAVFIFEFKQNESAASAISQIKEKGYDKRFYLSGLRLFLIGVNFLASEKRINDIKVEQWEDGVYKEITGNFV